MARSTLPIFQRHARMELLFPVVMRQTVRQVAEESGVAMSDVILSALELSLGTEAMKARLAAVRSRGPRLGRPAKKVPTVINSATQEGPKEAA